MISPPPPPRIRKRWPGPFHRPGVGYPLRTSVAPFEGLLQWTGVLHVLRRSRASATETAERGH